MRRNPARALGRLAAPFLVALLVAAGLAVQSPTGPDREELPPTTPVLGVLGQVHYLPFEGPTFLDLLRGQHGTATNVASPVRLIASLVSALDGNQVAIDHWEDGYDDDPIGAPGPTTEVFTMGEGENRVLQDLVDVSKHGQLDPEGNGRPYYDGGDRLVSTGALVVTAGGWPSGAGTLHANASVVPHVDGYGYDFVSPVGEDTPYPSTPSASLWEYVGFLVLAAEDGTTVTFEGGSTITLDAGESHLVDGGVALGDSVSSDKPILTYLATGDQLPGTGAYEGRLFRLVPTERWSDRYVTPVGSRNTSTWGTRVFLYNPGTAPITVDYTPSSGASGTISVPAGGQASHLTGVDVGTRFSSPGNPFYALQAITTPESGADQSAHFNWGLELAPAASLTPMVVVGYGPGSEPNGSGVITENDNAVWISAETATTLYVDLDADPGTGANTDPNGNRYDFSCAAAALQPRLIGDDGTGLCHSITGFPQAVGSGDGDMTGARIYTVDGTPIAAAWGQVPGLNAVAPAIDMGTSVLPFPTIDLQKTAEIVDDDGDGKAVPGDTIRYTITITNRGISPVDDLTVNDQVPEHTSYVAGSTVANGDPVTDPETGTPFPLDEGGMAVPPVLEVGETRTVTYDLLVDDPLPEGVTQIVNEITLQSDYGTYTDLLVTPVAEPGSIGDRVWDDVDGDGVQDDGEDGLVGVTVELVDAAGDVVATTVTGADGAYVFDGVYPGTYTVRVDPGTVPEGSGTSYDLDGTDSPDQAAVTLAEGQHRTDVDFGYAPASITLEKTVYAGHDAGASCPGDDVISGEVDDAVTYCFRVTNSGVLTLEDVGLDDADLAVDDTDMDVLSGSLGSLSPGQSVVLAYSDAHIQGDLLNTATAEAFVTAGGTPLTATDTAEVEALGADISIDKTVYRGHDDGEGCAGEELIQARAGDEVTYCFLVTNEGETNLSAVEVTDDALDIGSGGPEELVVPLLTPGESVSLHVEATVDGSLVNTAQVVGTSPSGAQPTDEDTAEVVEIDPRLRLDKTVYVGDDEGASCADADESATAVEDQVVTWCFTVTNEGAVVLTDLTIEDLPLSADQSDMTVLEGDLASLGPDDTVVLYLTTVAATDVANTATASGVPPVGPEVSDEDTASLDVVDPSLSIQKKVYGGHDGGTGCASAGDLHAGEQGAPVTWCFTVVNTGDTPLADVRVDDADLGVDEADLSIVTGSLELLAPGSSVVLHHDAALDAALVNTATATGSPPAGPDVEAQDVAEVEVLVPDVSVAKTVYAGHDDGAGCDDGGEEQVLAQAGAPVTWCFTVTNTGQVDLDVGVVDDLVGFSDSTDGLAPGTSVTIWSEGTVDGSHVNTVLVTGETPEGDEVDDEDTAEVVEIAPDLGVTKTVYLGHDGGLGCEGSASVEAEIGQPVTWCFAVTNTGDTDLVDLRLDDPVLGVDQSDVTILAGGLDVLAPGATVLAHVDGVVSGDVVNTVTASGTAPDGSEPDADDTAEVAVIGPQIGIAKSIVDGPRGNGDGTYTLTYRLRVANAGETRLQGVRITDDLAATFAGVRHFRVDALSSADLSVNPAYNGRPSGSTEVLTGADDLVVGARGDVDITVTVNPGSNLGPYENSAVAFGTSPGGEGVEDISDSGSRADPTDPNLGEPGDTGGTDDPVPVDFPAVDLTVDKSVGAILPEGNSALIEWVIVVHNLGPGDDPGPVTVTDDLDPRLRLLSSDGDGWDCTRVRTRVSCDWDGPLASGGSTTAIRLLTTVTVTEDTEIPNRARVASTVPESRTDNNAATAEVTAEVLYELIGDRLFPSDSLPRTGVSIAGLVLLGLGLVLGGRLLQRRAAAAG